MTAPTRQPVPQTVPRLVLALLAQVVAAVLLLVVLASADAFAGVATAAHQHGGESPVSQVTTDVVFEDIAGHAALVSDPTAVATAVGSSADGVGGAGSADRVGGSERPAAPVGRGGGLSGFAGLTPPVRVPFRRSWDVRDVCRSRFATAQLGDPVSPTLRARPRRAPAAAGRGPRRSAPPIPAAMVPVPPIPSGPSHLTGAAPARPRGRRPRNGVPHHPFRPPWRPGHQHRSPHHAPAPHHPFGTFYRS